MTAARSKRAVELRRRHRELLEIESALWLHGLSVAGLDEVGAGPLAGPVVAACVVLDPSKVDELVGVDDSKSVAEPRRSVLAERIQEYAFAVGMGQASVEEIDALNIREAGLLAMDRALQQAQRAQGVDHLLVDARKLPGWELPQSELIGGDRRSMSIAAASIVAKVHRDAMMVEVGREYPEYGFGNHKGYGTAEHLRALSRFGVTPVHRRSFAPVRKALGQPELFE